MLDESQSQQASKESAAAEKKGAMGKRDAEIYVALGCFIVFVGIPVLAGTYWAAQTNPRAAVVNLVCSLVLLGMGVASIVYGRILLSGMKKRQ